MIAWDTDTVKYSKFSEISYETTFSLEYKTIATKITVNLVTKIIENVFAKINLVLEINQERNFFFGSEWPPETDVERNESLPSQLRVIKVEKIVESDDKPVYKPKIRAVVKQTERIEYTQKTAKKLRELVRKTTMHQVKN